MRISSAVRGSRDQAYGLVAATDENRAPQFRDESLVLVDRPPRFGAQRILEQWEDAQRSVQPPGCFDLGDRDTVRCPA